MNHASLKSAKRWQGLGLFQDSEFVWNKSLAWGKKKSGKPYVIERTMRLPLNKIIGPAPHCEEMGDYLYYFTDIQVTKEGDNLYCFGKAYCDTPYKVDVVCKTETEAREKAINWHLDQKEG